MFLMEVLFLIVGGLFAFLGILLLREQKKALSEGRPVKAKVVGYVDGKTLGQGAGLYPVFRANWQGRDCFLRSPVGSLHPLYELNKEVTLQVSNTLPPKVALHSRALQIIAWAFLGMGLILCGVFYLTFHWNWFSLLMAAVVVGSLIHNTKKSQVGKVTLKEWMEKTRSALLQDWMTDEAVQKLVYVPSSFIEKQISRHKAQMKVAALMMILGSGVGMYFGEFWLERRHQFLQSAVRTEGRIADYESSHSSSGFVYYPVVTFRNPSSEEVRFRHSVGSSHPSYQVGQNVYVLYDPNDPKKAMIDSGWANYLGPLLVLIFSAFFAALGFRQLFS